MLLIIFVLINPMLGFNQDTTQVIMNSIESFIQLNVKQLDEFIYRFNGDTLSKLDSTGLKNRNLIKLIDYEYYSKNTIMSDSFIKYINASKFKIKFGSKSWYSIADCSFLYNGKIEKVRVYLQLSETDIGKYRWVIRNVEMPFINIEYKSDNNIFINPVNNETNFSEFNLYINKDHINNIVEEKYKTDFLTLFVFLVKTNKLKYKSVDKIKYVFNASEFQFEVNEINRKDFNTGWLINSINIDRSKVPTLNYMDYLQNR